MSMFIVILECADVILNCSECSAYNICTACDGDLVVNSTNDGCTGKMQYRTMQKCFLQFEGTSLIYIQKEANFKCSLLNCLFLDA